MVKAVGRHEGRGLESRRRSEQSAAPPAIVPTRYGLISMTLIARNSSRVMCELFATALQNLFRIRMISLLLKPVAMRSSSSSSSLRSLVSVSLEPRMPAMTELVRIHR